MICEQLSRPLGDVAEGNVNRGVVESENPELLHPQKC